MLIIYLKKKSIKIIEVWFIRINIENDYEVTVECHFLWSLISS